MRFKLEIDDEAILAFIEDTARRAIRVAVDEGLETAAVSKDDVSTSGGHVTGTVISAFINAAVTMKVRTLELKSVSGFSFGPPERTEKDDVPPTGSS